MVQANVIIICGPTCVGKTSVGVELAKRFNGEIISADSQQVYKDLDLGTAKPPLEVREIVRHHLIDIISPAEQFDAAKFVEMADIAVGDITNRGKIPFIVGGTGLYIKAFLYGLARAPSNDDKYREELELLKQKNGTPYLYNILKKGDPATAARLKPNDSTRIIRALEVLRSTGTSISELQSGHGFKLVRYNALKIGLNIDRKELYGRINERVDKIFADGLADEAKALFEKYGTFAPAFKAVGYKELAVGQGDYDTIVELIKRNTRRYAKRQLTWFRADKEIKWFEPEDISGIAKCVNSFLNINDKELRKCPS